MHSMYVNPVMIIITTKGIMLIILGRYNVFIRHTHHVVKAHSNNNGDDNCDNNNNNN